MSEDSLSVERKARKKVLAQNNQIKLEKSSTRHGTQVNKSTKMAIPSKKTEKTLPNDRQEVETSATANSPAIDSDIGKETGERIEEIQAQWVKSWIRCHRWATSFRESLKEITWVQIRKERVREEGESNLDPDLDQTLANVTDIVLGTVESDIMIQLLLLLKR